MFLCQAFHGRAAGFIRTAPDQRLICPGMMTEAEGQPAALPGSKPQTGATAASASGSGPRPFLRRNAGIHRRATSSLDARYMPKGGFVLEVTEHKPKVSKAKILRQARLQAGKQAPGVLRKPVVKPCTPASMGAPSPGPSTPSKVTFQEALPEPKATASEQTTSAEAPANTSVLSTRLKSMLSSVTQSRQADAAQVVSVILS